MPQCQETGIAPTSSIRGDGRPEGRSLLRDRLASAVVIAMPLALIAWLYAHSLVRMAAIWEVDPDYSHGYLIPVLSGVFAYACFRRYGSPLGREVPRDVFASGLLQVAAGVFLHFFAIVLGNHVFDVVSLIIVLRGAMTALGGRQAARDYAFPVFFLLFMAPLPQSWQQPVALAFQQIAAAVSATTFEILGVPVYRDGYLIYLPNDVMEVGAACSGLRGLTAIVALATAIAFIGRYRSAWYRWTIILSAPAVAIVANCIRVVATGFIVMGFGAKWAQGVYHEGGGLVVIMTSALIVAGIAWTLAPWDRRLKDTHTPCD